MLVGGILRTIRCTYAKKIVFLEDHRHLGRQYQHTANLKIYKYMLPCCTTHIHTESHTHV